MFKYIGKGNFSTRTHTQVRFAEKKGIAESGRSMVEMLGALAIIGILSMVGIKAFNAGMTQHRANELINEAQKRAVVVAAQIMAGRDNLSVAEFKNLEGYTFGVEKNPANPKQFNITLYPVPTDVCTKMKAMVDSGSVVRVISEFCDKLTFNNDLSQINYASDIQTTSECASAGYTWCEGSSSCSEIGCCEGKGLQECQSCSKGAIITGPKEGKVCDYDKNGISDDGICHLGQCLSLPSTMNCNGQTGICNCNNGGVLCNWESGLCCTSTEMCNSNGDANATNEAKCLSLSGECTTNADCTEENKGWCQITEYTNCRTPARGTCASIEDVQEVTIYGLGDVLAGPKMNWWSAKNWCEAQGKRLVNIEDFQVYRSDNGTLLRTGAAISTPPCRQGKNCVRWDSGDASNMWAGDSGEAARTLTHHQDESGEFYYDKYSPVVLDLAQRFRGSKGAEGSKNYIWTASEYSGSSSCSSYLVQVSLGYVRDSAHNNTNFVLCY